MDRSVNLAKGATMRIATSRFVLVWLVAAAIARAGGAQQPLDPAPRLVSPGGRDRALASPTACPTFSWGGAPVGRELELLVYEIAEGAPAAAPLLRERLPAGSTAWTPSADRCLAPRRYAWTVRTVGDTDRGSEVFVFVVPEERAGERDAPRVPRLATAEPSPSPPSPESRAAGTPSAPEVSKSAGANRSISAPVITPCGTFVDVDAADPFCTWILSATASDLMEACATNPDPRFCPTGPVTRQQLAKALASEEHLPQGCQVGDFPIWNGSDWECLQNVCGNGFVGDGEQCDNGNTPPQSQCTYGTPSCVGCTNACLLVVLSGPYCGDGIVQLQNEECDDGNSVTEVSCPYGTAPCSVCSSFCELVPLSNGEVCGDAIVQSDHEDCDDGNTLSCGGCSADCRTVQAPAAATGMVVVPPSASLADAETFTLNDGIGNTVVFEFDRNGDGLIDNTHAGVVVTGVLTDVQVRNACRTAINNQIPLAITAGSLGGQIVTLVHDRSTAAGNIPISDTVLSSGFVTLGMSGGVSGNCGLGVECAADSNCLSGFCDAGFCANP
jgi:cysteine-rich repeat protein